MSNLAAISIAFLLFSITLGLLLIHLDLVDIVKELRKR